MASYALYIALVVTPAMETYRTTEGTKRICFNSNSASATVQIVTHDKTAIGEFKNGSVRIIWV